MNSIRRKGPRPGLAALLLLSAAVRISAAPQIAIDNPIYDFGSVINGSQILHDFMIRNAGDSELDISHVDSSCAACLQASLEKSKIPPGGQSVLHARLDLRLLNGTVSRAVAIGSNDPNNDLVLVGFTGEVVPLYQITPPEIQIDLSQGRQTASVEIAPMVNLHAPLSQVHCDDRNVAAGLSQDEAGRFVLTVQALDSLPRGNTRVRLTLSTADSNDPPCSVLGLIRNPPDLELIPEKLRFLPQEGRQMRILWLKQHGASPLALLDVIPPSGKFQCEIDPDPDGCDYRIYITAWDQNAPAGGAATLTLKMRDQNQRERLVAVPVSVN